MKNIIFRLYICISFLAIISCGKDSKEQKNNSTTQQEDHISTKLDINLTNSKSKVIFTDAYIDKVYQQYLLIKRGLVNTNPKVVQQEAKKLETIINSAEDAKQLKATAKLISLTKEIKKQRDFFVTLTQETTKLISSSAITSGEVYKQFCPMAFDGAGGYWLSDSKEIRNPYYGSKMLKCGSVKEAIQ